MRNETTGHIIGHIIAGLTIGTLVGIPLIYRIIAEALTGGHVYTLIIAAAVLIPAIATVASLTNAYHFHHAASKIKAAGLTLTPQRINAHASDSLHRFNALTVAATFSGILYIVADLTVGAGLHVIGVPTHLVAIITAVAAVTVYTAAILEIYPHTLQAIRTDKASA